MVAGDRLKCCRGGIQHISDHPRSSFAADSVKEIRERIPNQIDGTILVDTTKTRQEWEAMIDERNSMPCKYVWHDGRLFITELKTGGQQQIIESSSYLVNEAMAPLRGTSRVAVRCAGSPCASLIDIFATLSSFLHNTDSYLYLVFV